MRERMEEIKEIYRWAIENSIANRIADSDIEWLINQAERVQDLKIMLKVLGEENQRYKHALEEIARGRFSGASYKARKALDND